MERKLGVLLALTLATVFALGWIIISEPGRVQSVEARAAEAKEGQGAQLYGDKCASCHGKFGEGVSPMGGPPPLSSREFLSTFNDATIRAVIARGKPSRGMPAFSKESGGQLAESEIGHLVTFIRNWQTSPPQIPPKAAAAPSAPAPAPPAAAPAAAAPAPRPATSPTTGEARAVPISAASTAAPPPASPAATATAAPTRAAVAAAPPPPAKADAPAASPPTRTEPAPAPPTPVPAPTKPAPPPPASVSFARDVLPALKPACAACHGTMSGYSVASYAQVVGSGDHKPVVVAGDPDKSILIQKLKGTQTFGAPMPMGQPMSAETIQKIADWIKAGAKDD